MAKVAIAIDTKSAHTYAVHPSSSLWNVTAHLGPPGGYAQTQRGPVFLGDGVLSLYNPSATLLESCIFLLQGCTDSVANNYWPVAQKDDGTCIYAGCTDSTRPNYDAANTFDDGSYANFLVIDNPVARLQRTVEDAASAVKVGDEVECGLELTLTSGWAASWHAAWLVVPTMLRMAKRLLAGAMQKAMAGASARICSAQ